MATRAKGAVLLPVVVVVAAIAVFGSEKVVDTVTSLFADGGTATIGVGDSRLLVAADAESDIEDCTTSQLRSERRCGKMNVLFVDASRMPFIARNTQQAWESGRPGILTMNRARQPQNRQEACGRFTHQYPPPIGSCDEYPMAATEEGGSGARTAEVPRRENSCQGGLYRPQYPRDGERFVVVIANPDNVARHDFAGLDIAKDQGWC